MCVYMYVFVPACIQSWDFFYMYMYSTCMLRSVCACVCFELEGENVVRLVDLAHIIMYTGRGEGS